MKKEEVVVGEEEKKERGNELFDIEAVGENDAKVVRAYAKRPRAALKVTKETILAAIDRGEVGYLRANRLTKKKTINTSNQIVLLIHIFRVKLRNPLNTS